MIVYLSSFFQEDASSNETSTQIWAIDSSTFPSNPKQTNGKCTNLDYLKRVAHAISYLSDYDAAHYGRSFIFGTCILHSVQKCFIHLYSFRMSVL